MSDWIFEQSCQPRKIDPKDETGNDVSRPRVKTIRAVSRAIDVLQLVQASGGMSLSDIHRELGLAKATLLRILLTLQDSGLIWQRMVDNAYLASYSLKEKARHLDDVSHLVEVASPILSQLTRRVQWPSILAVPRLDHMEVIETNSPHSYFHHIPLGPVGFQINMLMSATGRAYLAFCTETERAAVLSRLRHSQRPGDAQAKNQAWVDQILASSRKQGYGLRDAGFGGHYDRGRREWDDGRDSIAMPIVVDERVLGVINLTWIRKVSSRGDIIAKHVSDLSQAAQSISIRLSA